MRPARAFLDAWVLKPVLPLWMRHELRGPDSPPENVMVLLVCPHDSVTGSYRPL